jgi:hypothetical protein
MNFDWRHIVVVAVIALADVACLYYKLIPETAGVAVLTALVGVLIPSNYNSLQNKETPP